MSSIMIYKHKTTGIKIEVTKKDSSTWSFVDPETGVKKHVTKYVLKNDYKFLPKESKLKRFDSTSRRTHPNWRE